MNTRLHAALLVAFAICFPGITRAERAQRDTDRPPKKNAAEVARGDAFVSVIKQHTGEPILVIKYPWKRHARPSVEVRILAEDEVDNPLLRPLFFVHDIMRGEVTTAIYHCQDRSEHAAQTATFSEGLKDFSVFGARNLLGRPSVCVVCRETPKLSAETESRLAELGDSKLRSVLPLRSEPETTAVFCLLAAWAVDHRTLYLELPGEDFAQRSRIRVCFLRDKDVVWMADTTWPGAGE